MSAKTNAMRILDREKISYQMHEYDTSDGVIDGVHVAAKCGMDPARVYKTLVTAGSDHAYYVFVIPVAAELDLKACARAVGVKSVEMIHVKDINRITGYIRGGCSPVGMKKPFVTVYDQAILDIPTVYVSGGRIGLQIEAAPADLIRATNGKTEDITHHD